MKHLAIAAVILLTLTTLSFAQTAAPQAATETVTLRGTIIDNQCAGKQAPEQLGTFIKTHTKQCALLPACVASGYSIFADGKLTKFDKASNAKVEEFLRKPESKLDVLVVAKKAGNKLELISIMNQ
jgi:type 1 fimbria pilin